MQSQTLESRQCSAYIHVNCCMHDMYVQMSQKQDKGCMMVGHRSNTCMCTHTKHPFHYNTCIRTMCCRNGWYNLIVITLQTCMMVRFLSLSAAYKVYCHAAVIQLYTCKTLCTELRCECF